MRLLNHKQQPAVRCSSFDLFYSEQKSLIVYTNKMNSKCIWACAFNSTLYISIHLFAMMIVCCNFRFLSMSQYGSFLREVHSLMVKIIVQQQYRFFQEKRTNVDLKYRLFHDNDTIEMFTSQKYKK